MADQTVQIRPQVVNLDWLAFSVTLALTDTERALGRADLKTPHGYVLVDCKHGTPQYKRRLYLQTLDGDKVLTLLLEPHAKIIDSRDMYVEVANSLLYSSLQLDNIMSLIASIHPFSFRSLSRIDVACDFQPSPEQEAIINGLQNLDMYVQGKGEGSQFHSFKFPSDGGQVSRHSRQLSWGAKQSSVKWKLYNKTLELYQPDSNGNLWCSKPYIPLIWAQHGMSHLGVWRLECSLTGASSYEWRGEKMGWQLIDTQSWANWYWDMVATRFIIRKNEGHICRKNDTIVPFLDIPDVDHYRLRERVGDSEQVSVDHASTLRACIKELQRPEIAFSPAWRQMWLNTTYQVLNQGKLHRYFLHTMGVTFEEWAATIGDELSGAD